MSRIGRMPISVPAGVDVKCADNFMTVKGPKGEISKQLSTAMTIEIADGVIHVTRPDDTNVNRSLHGLDQNSDRQHDRGCNQWLQQDPGD